MVVGLDTFKEFFKEYKDSYLIIGGTACDLLIEDAGFTPRATEDIDMILLVEGLNPKFVAAFWEFIDKGAYATKEYNPEKKNSYRFCNPATEDYPKQIELFCKVPEAIELKETLHLTPIPVDKGLSNLSAILLDHNYYDFTVKHSTIKDEVHYADIEAIICLKAFAYLDNKKRKEAGEEIRKVNIVKHKRDIFRLVFLLPPETRIVLPAVIQENLQEFVDTVREDLPHPDIFKNNGFGKQDMSKILDQLIAIFGLK